MSITYKFITACRLRRQPLEPCQTCQGPDSRLRLLQYARHRGTGQASDQGQPFNSTRILYGVYLILGAYMVHWKSSLPAECNIL
jgi:hypothetical protein